MRRETREHFKEGTFGFHELLDRTSLISEQFRMFITEHPSVRVAKNNKIRIKIGKIQDALWDLYQEIGAETL